MEQREFGVVEQRTWQVVTKNADGEPQVHDLLYERKLPEIPEGEYDSLFIRQAPPTVIRPSRKKHSPSDVETTVFMGDEHFPFQDDRALKLARLACRELNPASIVLLGDGLDVTNFSKYDSRKEWAGNLQGSIDAYHEHLAGLRAENPTATMFLHESNHHVRLERKIREYNGDLVGLRRANAERELGVLAVGFLLRLDELDIEHVTGYPQAELWHGDDIKSFHGTEAVPNGSTMARVIGKETVSCVQGHSHRQELIFRTFRDGKNDRTIFGMNPGCLADFDKVPKDTYSTTERGRIVPSRTNWQQGIGATFDGHPQIFPIRDGRIVIGAKAYKS